jgi:hypothetical protein
MFGGAGESSKWHVLDLILFIRIIFIFLGFGAPK